MMEKRTQIKILLTITLFLSITQISMSFNYLTYNSTQKIDDLLTYNKEEITNPKYLEDLEIYRKTKDSAILTTCMLQVRNSLYYNNNQLKEVLKNTNLSKDKIFDKFVVELYNSCKQELIKKPDVTHYLQPERAMSADDLLEKMTVDPAKLLTDPVFTDSEKELLSIFYKGSLKKQASSVNSSDSNKVEFSASIPELNEGVLYSILNLNANILKYLAIGLISGVLSALILYYLTIFLISKIKKGLSEVVPTKDGKRKKK